MDETNTRLNSLVQIRKASGLTQAQAAGHLGVSKATYSAWETGRAELGADRIIALAELYGCAPNDILGYTDTPEVFSPLTDGEEELVALFRRLPPNIREDILDIMRTTARGWSPAKPRAR